MACNYYNPPSQKNQKQLLKIVSEMLEDEAAEEAINNKNDPFKDLSTDELEEIIKDLRERFPKQISTELNTAVF